MRKVTGSYRNYSIPDKTAALVFEFAVEDLPSAELLPRFARCSEGPALGLNTDYIYRVHINALGKLEKLVPMRLLQGFRSLNVSNLKRNHGSVIEATKICGGR